MNTKFYLMYRSLVQLDINFGQTKEKEMKLIDFISKFPDEESCKTKLREYRERQGDSLVLMRKHSALLEAEQEMLWVQELPLPPEPEGQYCDVREPASGQVLVYSNAPVDKHEEEHIGVRTPVSARP